MRVRRLTSVLALYQPFSHVVNDRPTQFSLRYRRVALLARSLVLRCSLLARVSFLSIDLKLVLR